MDLQVVPQVHRELLASIIHYHIDVPLPNGDLNVYYFYLVLKLHFCLILRD